MYDAITDVRGIEVGHAQDAESLTGCTVVLARQGAVVGVDVRGAAPGTRETDLCRPGTVVERAHAIVLAGGSAFGLAAAAGVMRYLWERGIGLEVGPATVPIVPAAILFDFGIGEIAWPDEGMGYEACIRATGGPVIQGCVGVGTGATVGKILGPSGATKSGVGTACIRCTPGGGDEVAVAALVAVNAFGNVVDPASGGTLAGARDAATGQYVDAIMMLTEGAGVTPSMGTNTTVGVVATDARLSPDQVNHLAAVAHDGLARTIRPVHTMFDGDTIFGLATGRTSISGALQLVAVTAAAVLAVERAVLRAVEHATPAGGFPAMIKPRL